MKSNNTNRHNREDNIHRKHSKMRASNCKQTHTKTKAKTKPASNMQMSKLHIGVSAQRAKLVCSASAHCLHENETCYLSSSKCHKRHEIEQSGTHSSRARARYKVSRRGKPTRKQTVITPPSTLSLPRSRPESYSGEATEDAPCTHAGIQYACMQSPEHMRIKPSTATPRSVSRNAQAAY